MLLKRELKNKTWEKLEQKFCSNCGRKLKARTINKDYNTDDGTLETLYFIFNCFWHESYSECVKVHIKEYPEFNIFSRR